MPSIKIKQHDIRDCGAACLASIGNHYGVNLPIARIRQFANTDKRGTNVLGIIEAAEKMGFTTKGVKGDIDAIPKIPLPAIAHIIVKKQLQHYVVIYMVTKKKIEVMDPGTGKLITYSYEEFKNLWTGVFTTIKVGGSMAAASASAWQRASVVSSTTWSGVLALETIATGSSGARPWASRFSAMRSRCLSAM